MDLNTLHINTAAWKGIRLVAFFFFAVAGVLLVASLVAPSRGHAEAGLWPAPAHSGSPPPDFAARR